MAWFMRFSLLFVFFWGALAQTISNGTIEITTQCSPDFKVAGVDFAILKFLLTGSSSSYPLQNGFYTPTFYYNQTSTSDPTPVCQAFDLGTNACVDRRPLSDTCSCIEITSGSEYQLIMNLTLKVESTKQDIWLEWPPKAGSSATGPLVSEVFTMPEIRDTCPSKPTEETCDRCYLRWVLPVLVAVAVVFCAGVIIFVKLLAKEKCSTTIMAFTIVFAVLLLIAFVVTLAVCHDCQEYWELVLQIFGIIVLAAYVVWVLIYIKVNAKGLAVLNNGSVEHSE